MDFFSIFTLTDGALFGHILKARYGPINEDLMENLQSVVDTGLLFFEGLKAFLEGPKQSMPSFLHNTNHYTSQPDRLLHFVYK